MRDEFTWMLFLILPLMVMSRPVQEDIGHVDNTKIHAPSEAVAEISDDEVISVSITSSVAVGRGKSTPREIQEPADDLVARIQEPADDLVAHETVSATPAIAKFETIVANETHQQHSQSLAGANIEFIKQLHSKKEARGTHHLEVHPFQLQIKHHATNESSEPTDHTDDPSLQITEAEIQEDIENIPLGRSVALSPSSHNRIQGLSLSERGQVPRLTTVSFNIMHDTPKTIPNYNEQSKLAPAFPDLQPVYSEPPKIYSQPAQVYSEPAKFYSEPAKVYSEPAKIYSEPAKVYSEPAKVYSEPAKFYSPAASLNLPPQEAPAPTPWQDTASAVVDTTPSTTSGQPELRPEKNYEVDEKDSVSSDGQSHGVQESGPESCKDDSCKVGYVVEGRQYRKYRVEERTSDGFIVGEYGVVRNEDGALRGVRYTADGDASPRLIYDALMKFLQLK